MNTPSPLHKIWLAGYMSGMSSIWVNGDPLGQLQNAQQFIAWMDNYCRAHPLKTVIEGAVDLYAELVMKQGPAK